MITLREEHSKFVKLYSFSSGATSPTNIKLVEEMISHLNEDLFKNPNTKFLDPCAGTGTFGVVLFDKLVEYHEPRWILERMIYMVDTSRVNCDILKKLGFVNVYNEDFLTLSLDMTFDVVLGNPPYQKDGNPQVKLWPKIVEKSLDLLKDSGTLLAIFPLVWTKRPTGQKWSNLVETFQEIDLTYVKIDDCNKFFREEDTAYIEIKNQKYNGITKIETTSNKYTSEIKYKGQPILLSDEDLIEKNIIDKVNIKKEKWDWYEDLDHNNSKEYLFNNNILLKQNKENTLPVWYTASQKYYTNEANVKKGYRVLVNLSGYYFSDDLPNKYIKVCFNEGCTSGMRAILVKSEDEGNRVKKILTSKLYRFYNDSQKTSGFNTSIGKMPKLDINKNWGDCDLYKEFNLTQEEIDYIEKYVG